MEYEWNSSFIESDEHKFFPIDILFHPHMSEEEFKHLGPDQEPELYQENLLTEEKRGEQYDRNHTG